MEIICTTIGFCLFSYLLGSIPFGYMVAKSKGIDIRSIGSGNIGATNVGRALGKKWQYIVLVLDALKGIAAVLLAKQLFKSHDHLSSFLPLLAGICVIAGHNWTIFLKFKGGKGVSTTAGVILALSPIAFLAGLGTYLVTTKITKYVSLGSMLGSIAISIVIFLLPQDRKHPIYLQIFGILISGLVVFRHKENIKRLLKGEEAKIVKS